jgi:hypothetical protein
MLMLMKMGMKYKKILVIQTPKIQKKMNKHFKKKVLILVN